MRDETREAGDVRPEVAFQPLCCVARSFAFSFWAEPVGDEAERDHADDQAHRMSASPTEAVSQPMPMPTHRAGHA
jgi:hypothetical protein